MSEHPARPQLASRRRRKRPGVAKRIAGRRVILLGMRRFDIRDLYHLVLTLTWPQFIGAVFLFYILVNSAFAIAYLASPGSIVNARPGSFADAFFFSTETLATVGYGYMNPRTNYGHVVAVIEILFGMMTFAVITGLVFERFSRPTARVVFSRNVVVDSFNGQPTLMLRAANQRGNQILEASASVALVRDEVTAEGQAFRRFYELALVRSRSPAFALTWTIMHTIGPDSPLYGLSADSLHQCAAALSVSIAGLDETFAQVVHARHHYRAAEILFGHRFVDLLVSDPDSEPEVDLRKIHDVIPVPAARKAE